MYYVTYDATGKITRYGEIDEQFLLAIIKDDPYIEIGDELRLLSPSQIQDQYRVDLTTLALTAV